jgi:hypothetical protein
MLINSWTLSGALFGGASFWPTQGGQAPNLEASFSKFFSFPFLFISPLITLTYGDWIGLQSKKAYQVSGLQHYTTAALAIFNQISSSTLVNISPMYTLRMKETNTGSMNFSLLNVPDRDGFVFYS